MIDGSAVRKVLELHLKPIIRTSNTLLSRAFYNKLFVLYYYYYCWRRLNEKEKKNHKISISIHFGINRIRPFFIIFFYNNVLVTRKL